MTQLLARIEINIMTAKDLAEAMLDGSLNYSPIDDACFIARRYIALQTLIEEVLHEYSTTEKLTLSTFSKALSVVEYDPAKSL